MLRRYSNGVNHVVKVFPNGRIRDSEHLYAEGLDELLPSPIILLGARLEMAIAVHLDGSVRVGAIKVEDV